MAKPTHKLHGNQESVVADGSRRTAVRSADNARASERGCPEGIGSQRSRGDKIENNVPDDRFEKGEQLNPEGHGDVRARVELKRGLGPPLPIRGAVAKTIAEDIKEGVKAGVKKLTHTGRAFCCAPGPFDVDALVRDLPSPSWSEPTATLWAKVEE